MIVNFCLKNFEFALLMTNAYMYPGVNPLSFIVYNSLYFLSNIIFFP